MNKGTTIAICALATGAILWCQGLRANPQGGTVTAGSATIGATAPNTLTIDQTSGRVIINWQSFSINAGEVTRFVQPSATAAALNRVITANPSLLYGTLQANGRIFLINQNGILVGKGGQINTAGFTASTLSLSDTAFLGGKSLHFVGDSTAAIDNFGSITALGGDVFLIAQAVQNSGTIRANAGEVGLAAGSDVMLVQSGNERLSVLAGNANTPPSTVGVNNVGQVEAAFAELSAAGGNIYALAINNGGVVRATGVASQNGRIVLRADGGNIQNSGTLVANNENGSGGTVIMDGGHNVTTPATVINSGVVQARGDAAGARGGTVEVLGDHVGLFGGAVVDVSGDAGGGTALIGGGLHGQNPSVGNAERTYVDQGAVIVADALSRGNGGDVVVWADDATAFYGTISARGGVRGGNGGSAEVSGKEALVYEGFADLRAPNGVMGDLLLDPHNITIANGGSDAISGNQFFTDNSAGDVTIDPANVVAALNGANLTLQANTDINVNDTIDASGNAGAGNLTLNAGRSIALAGGVSIMLQGSFTATINDGGAVTTDRDPGAATFSMGAGSSITAPGGIDVEAGTLAADNTGPTSVSANTGDMTLTTLNTAPSSAGAASGNIVVINNQAAAKSITISGTITASGANNGAGVGGGGGSITLNASGTLTLNVVASNGGNGTGGAGGGAGNVTLTGGNAIAVDGTITAQGGSGSSAGGAGVVALTANGPIAFNNNVTAASIISHSGGTGSGDTTFGVGVHINADSQSYQAGNGSGVAVVDLIDNTPAFRNTAGTAAPVAFTFEQDADIADANIPGTSQFGGTPPTRYTIQSDNGAVTLSTGVKVDGSALTLSAAKAIAINDTLILASMVSHSGTSGSGDTTFGAGIHINADSQSYQAGNGSGVAVVDLIDNTPAFRNTAGTAAPDTFTFEQDADIADADIPGASQFGGTPPTSYTIQSDNGIVTLNTGAKVAGSALTLSASGTLTINDALNLATLDANGSPIQLNSGTITTTGDQSYNGPVALGNDATLTGATVIFANTLDGAQALTVNGDAQFDGVVGGSTSLVSIHVTGAAALNSGTVTTTGDQNYDGAVTLGAGTLLTGGTVTFGSSVDGAQALTIDGNAVFGGDFGSVNPLSSLDVMGTTKFSSGAGTTTGDQNYGGAVTLGSDVTLTSDNGNITFNSTVDGNQFLTLSASSGTITVNGAVGGTTPLNTFYAQSAADVELNADVSATQFGLGGPTHFTGPRVISADFIYIASGEALTGSGRLTLQPLTAGFDIDLGSTGDSTHLGLSASELSQITADVLQIGNANAGPITISARVTSSATVLDLETEGSVSETAGAGIVAPQLAIRSGGPVLLSAHSHGSIGNNIGVIAVQINGAGAGRRILVLNDSVSPSLNTTIDGLVGLNPVGHVQLTFSGVDADTLAEQTAGLGYFTVLVPPPSISNFSSDQQVDQQMIVDNCGAGCIWTPGWQVPFSEEADEEQAPANISRYKIETPSKWFRATPSTSPTTSAPASAP